MGVGGGESESKNADAYVVFGVSGVFFAGTSGSAPKCGAATTGGRNDSGGGIFGLANFS